MKYKEQPAFEENKFKINDIFTVYGSIYDNSQFIVSSIHKEKIQNQAGFSFHFKQCRLLLPIEPREFWVTLARDGLPQSIYENLPITLSNCIKVREVLEDE